MTLTKADMAELLFDQVGLNKREAKDMVEAFFEEIRAALEAGDTVKLSGFGNFELRKKSERPGRNPKTGEEIPITARRVEPKTQKQSRRIVWRSKRLVSSFRQSLQSATSRLAKSATFVGLNRMFCATGNKNSHS